MISLAQLGLSENRSFSTVFCGSWRACTCVKEVVGKEYFSCSPQFQTKNWTFLYSSYSFYKEDFSEGNVLLLRSTCKNYCYRWYYCSQRLNKLSSRLPLDLRYCINGLFPPHRPEWNIVTIEWKCRGEPRERIDYTLFLNMSSLKFSLHLSSRSSSTFCNFEFHLHSGSIMLHLVFHFSFWRLYSITQQLIEVQSCHLKAKVKNSRLFFKVLLHVNGRTLKCHKRNCQKEKEGTRLTYPGQFFKRVILNSFQIPHMQPTLFNNSLTIVH